VIGDKRALPADEIAPVACFDSRGRAPLRARAFAALQPIAIWAFIRSVGYLVGRSVPRIDPRWQVGANLVSGIAAILLIWWATAGGENRTVTLRIAWPPPFSAIPLGTLGVVQAYALVLPLTFALEPHLEDGRKLADLALLTWIPGWLMLPLTLSIGFWEELLVRGLLLSRLRALFPGSQAGLWSAILLSSAIFGLSHPHQGVLGMIQTFTAGIVLATIVVTTGSLWPAVIAHAGIDVIAMVVARQLLGAPP
jgi:membrane protease YdiL (CAAX protease family)